MQISYLNCVFFYAMNIILFQCHNLCIVFLCVYFFHFCTKIILINYVTRLHVHSLIVFMCLRCCSHFTGSMWCLRKFACILLVWSLCLVDWQCVLSLLYLCYIRETRIIFYVLVLILWSHFDMLWDYSCVWGNWS